MSIRRKIAAFSMVLAAAGSIVGTPVLAAEAAKPSPPTTATPAPAAGPVYREYELGKASAKVTVIEYASLTCPHCAHFAQDNFPTLKKDYIDTGKIKYIYRDYPLDGLAAAAALIARCAPGDRGFTLIELLFKNQLTWVQAPSPIEPLRMYAKQTGMSDADVDACLKNQGILDSIRSVQSTADSLYKVAATPTFLIGDDRVDGADYDKLKALIDKNLGTKTK
jgi:protein-disulfide isomerase